jgi:hypothetical protein
MESNQTKALHYFIKESNVGELNYVIDDIGNIIGNKDFLTDPEIVQALREYYEGHLSHQTATGGEKVVVSERGRRENDSQNTGEGEGDNGDAKPTEFTYVDEARNIKFILDVTTGECKVVSDSEKHSDEAVQGFKESLVESVDKYIAEDFKEGATLGTVSIEGDSDLTIHIQISCHNLNHKNFWGGEWLSKWEIKHTINSNDFELSGCINIVNHYFEQGNIQFKLEKKFEGVKGAVKGDIHESIISTIAKLEEEYQTSLEDLYEEISDTHMKSLRRKLPVTGKSFEWGIPKLM